jgi:hypothetical protein
MDWLPSIFILGAEGIAVPGRNLGKALNVTLLSSNAVHVPVRLLIRAMLGFKTPCHLLQHCSFLGARNQRGNRDTILVTVRLNYMFQLPVFAFCPFARTSNR